MYLAPVIPTFSLGVLLLSLFTSCAGNLKSEKNHSESKEIQLESPPLLNMISDREETTGLLKKMDAQSLNRARVLTGIRERGWISIKSGSLPRIIKELDNGNPIVVEQGTENSPFALVVGYELKHEKLFLVTGKDSEREMSFFEFMQAWEKGDFWARAILPLKSLEASRNLGSIFDEALKIENAAPKKARLIYQKLIQLNNDGAAFYIAYAQNVALSNPGLAVHLLQTAIKKDPNNYRAWRELNALLRDNGQSKKASKLAQKILAMFPEQGESYAKVTSNLTGR
ncbi:MAG: tetratricopeptide repeat protein [Bacteriovoracaceae bacterium]